MKSNKDDMPKFTILDFIKKNLFGIIIQVSSLLFLFINLYLSVRLLPFEFRIRAIEERNIKADAIVEKIPIIEAHQGDMSGDITEIKQDLREIKTDIKSLLKK